MRNYTITACLIVCLLLSNLSAHAAKWTNGTFSCDQTGWETAPMMSRIDAYYRLYLTEASGSFVTFHCVSSTFMGTYIGCYEETSSHTLSYKTDFEVGQLSCDEIFNKSGLRRK